MVRATGFAPAQSASQAEMLNCYITTLKRSARCEGRRPKLQCPATRLALLPSHFILQTGAPGRTRTDEYEFTKLALWLLRHRGKWRPRQDSHLRPPPSHGGALVLTELRGQMASVIGLAPIRPGLKGRLLDLLCIHGRKVVPEVGSAPTSPPLQGGANLPQLLGEMARRAEARRAKTGRPGR